MGGHGANTCHIAHSPQPSVPNSSVSDLEYISPPNDAKDTDGDSDVDVGAVDKSELQSMQYTSSETSTMELGETFESKYFSTPKKRRTVFCPVEVDLGNCFFLSNCIAGWFC